MENLEQKMCTWMSRELPKLAEDWWEELVLNNLSMAQREYVLEKQIRNLAGLDLSALLRVFDRNWFIITSTLFLNNRERRNVKKMQEVRNTWGHQPEVNISKEKVCEDVKTILALMDTFGANMNETRELEEFLYDVEDDRELKPYSDKEKVIEKHEVVNQSKKEIVIGSLVTLESDASMVGAVIGISGEKYSVLVDGQVQSFYREQIRLKTEDRGGRRVTHERMKSALTAYQIHNPGSTNLYSLNSARIDFVPYQFRPALKMIKSDSPRLLVADDVGVGKTIEAGLILKELEARSSINSVLIICPRPLVAERKWVLEMKRFDEDFTQLDGSLFAQAIQETDRDGEWPDRHKKTVIPYSLFSEDSIMGRGARTNRKKKQLGLNELDPLPHFDLVIVDEAHNIRNANTWMYQGVELFCQNADAVVFLTATPLQNSNQDLFTLLNLLRPDVVTDRETFKTMAEPNRYINNLLRIVRSQKDDWCEEAKQQLTYIMDTSWGRNVIQHNPKTEKIFDFLGKEHVTREEKMEAVSMIESLHSFDKFINRTRRKDIEDFCIRRAETLQAPFNEVQKDLYEALIEFEQIALTRLHGSRSVRFMMCTVMRQAASCIYGLAPFMDDLVARRMEQIQKDGEMYEFDFTMNSDEEDILFELADEIHKLSHTLTENDPKFNKMLEVIEQKQNEENNRVIVFSSFRHTLRYIMDNLTKKGIRVGQVDGSVEDEERYAIRQRFLLDRDNENAIDVLLFSEVGCEGLDYQFCDTMINYDLPWNPMRIEQRIGRIDRRGQKSDTVKIYNMITEDTIDAVIYHRCLEKIGVFNESIGDCSEILGDITEQISKIMFNSSLTDEERQMKIEQMADNEVMKVQEMKRLEQEEKSLYGFDLTTYMMKQDVQEAENVWISPTSIQQLVNMYLNDILGQGEYIRGKSELKTLRLSSEKRLLLLEELKKNDIVNSNDASRLWLAYLKSDKPTLPVTFDSVCAKDNRKATFFTQMHPLVLQASRYESRNFPLEIGITVSSDEIPSGEYEFLIFAWKYIGIRPDVKLIAISDNKLVQESVLSLLEECQDYQFDSGIHEEKWDAMDELHYKKWQVCKENYEKDIKEECEFRIDQFKQSYKQRAYIYRQMIDKAEDDKIRRMRQSQLDKLDINMAQFEGRMEETMKKADIHTNLLVKGVLHVN